MPDAPAYDAQLADRVIELGRQGFSRAQIAAKLGVDVQRLAAWAADPDFAAALQRADSEERAWWDAQVHEAVWAARDKPFHASAWAKAMAQRFGSAAHRKSPKPEPAKPKERVVFNLPDPRRSRART